jgi:hypothetical protein
MAIIISLSGVARETAKKWFRAKKTILWFTLILGLIAIFLYKAPSLCFASTIGITVNNLPEIELILAVIAISSQIIGVVCLFRALYLHRLSREGIRRGMLLDSFGITTETLDLAYLTQKFTKKMKEKAVLIEDDYYSSTKACGLLRLRENLQESAFFTGNLFRLAGWHNLICLTIPAVIVLVLSFLLPLFRAC